MTKRLWDRGGLAIVVAWIGFVVSGCATASNGGAWTEAGFEEQTYRWKASYAASQKELLGPDWRLENWAPGMDGTLEQTHGAGYYAQGWAGPNDDGDTAQALPPAAELKFVSKRNDGVIWARTRVLSDDEAGKDLEVLVENYESGLLGGGPGSLAGGHMVGFATTRRATQLGGRAAVSEMLEVAGSLIIQVDPKARTGKLCIVLSKFTFKEPPPPPDQSAPSATLGPAAAPKRRVARTRTAVLLVGYVNDMEHFHEGLATFDEFLSRIGWLDEPPPGERAKPDVPSGSPAAAPQEEPEKEPEKPASPPPSPETPPQPTTPTSDDATQTPA
jgi:hypothetical protein